MLVGTSLLRWSLIFTLGNTRKGGRLVPNAFTGTYKVMAVLHSAGVVHHAWCFAWFVNSYEHSLVCSVNVSWSEIVPFSYGTDVVRWNASVLALMKLVVLPRLVLSNLWCERDLDPFKEVPSPNIMYCFILLQRIWNSFSILFCGQINHVACFSMSYWNNGKTTLSPYPSQAWPWRWTQPTFMWCQHPKAGSTTVQNGKSLRTVVIRGTFL